MRNLGVTLLPRPNDAERRFSAGTNRGQRCFATRPLLAIATAVLLLLVASASQAANVRNVSNQGKIVILEGASNSESSDTAPTINAVRGVWGNTSAQITSVTLNSGSGNNLLSGTEMWVWGSN